MTVFFLRDDDPNATTDPERIERTYAPLLDAGLRMAFSVIPRVALDTRDPGGARERFIHPTWDDGPDEVTLTPGTPLGGWLRRHASDVDVLMHGLSHGRVRGGTELGALDFAEADARFVTGRDILKTAVGSEPMGLVAPWDALSRGALEAASRRFPFVSTGFLDRRRLPPRAWPAHAAERLARREVLKLGGSWIVRHRGGRFDGKSSPESVPGVLDELARGAEVAVVVLHHWMFWDGPSPHPVIVALARALKGRMVCGVADVVKRLDAADHGPNATARAAIGRAVETVLA